VVIRLEGTNAQEASELLHDSEHDFIVASSLADGAEQVVKAANQEN
jgi:succinyl-CoA synthetase beta subunit